MLVPVPLQVFGASSRIGATEAKSTLVDARTQATATSLLCPTMIVPASFSPHAAAAALATSGWRIDCTLLASQNAARQHPVPPTQTIMPPGLMSCPQASVMGGVSGTVESRQPFTHSGGPSVHGLHLAGVLFVPFVHTLPVITTGGPFASEAIARTAPPETRTSF